MRKPSLVSKYPSSHGMTLIEVVLAIFIFVMASLILFRAFTANKRFSLQTRDRTAAQLLMSNLMEEVKAHPFGRSAPKTWPPDQEPADGWESAGFPEVQTVPVCVEGKTQRMVFHRKLTFEGSLVGKGRRNYDTVYATISWKDPGSPELKSLEAILMVRR